VFFNLLGNFMNQYMEENGLSIISTKVLNQLQQEKLITEMPTDDSLLHVNIEEMQNWPLGLTLVSKDRKPIGQIACKTIFRQLVPINHNKRQSNNDYVSREFALIGAMYVNKAMRGYGLAKVLLSQLTEETFNFYPNVCAAVANCNTYSAKVFSALSYYPSPLRPPLLPQKQGKTTYELTRNIWILTQNLANGIQ